MYSVKDFNPKNAIVTAEQAANLAILCDKVNQFCAAYGHYPIITSGLRSMADHLAIYAKKGITDLSKIPMGSSHLKGCAVDLYDPDGSFKQWVLKNLEIAEQLGLYFEDFASTINWLHIQTIRPNSGNRIFKIR
jgi:hypothetical protein